MSEAQPLKSLFHVKSRFARSVSITADYDDPGAVGGYIASPLARAALRRIVGGLWSDSRMRAWSITGPYGAGKSSWALFVAKVLAYPCDSQARARLNAYDPRLYADLRSSVPLSDDDGFVVVPVVGSREAPAPAILRGVIRAFNTTLGAEAWDYTAEVQRLLEQTSRGDTLSSTALTEVVERGAQLAAGKHLGLLIILDELGKFLEYSALNPDKGDIFLLQALAEAAARSGTARLVLVVLLHQAFEHYTTRLRPLQQREWAKVQGRFEDIGFLESSAELLKLVGHAIEAQPTEPSPHGAIELEARAAIGLGLAPRELGDVEALPVLARCAPFHPTVALVLGKLFRSRLAQNERSLFAFLTSGEPHGFQEYLSHAVWQNEQAFPFYRLDQLYDYVLAALGSSLYSTPQGKRWAEIEDTLERLPRESSELEARLIKTVGMLGLLGDGRYLKASEAVLLHCLADRHQVQPDHVCEALERLTGWNMIAYRHHRDAYSLWEGSDIELDERFQKGLDQVVKTASLATLFEVRGQLQPYIAKRHMHHTGTLRYLEPRIADLDHLQSALERPMTADGLLIFVLGENGASPQQTLEAALHTVAQLSDQRRPLLWLAVPKDTVGLRQAVEEVLAWEWVQQNTPQLEGDSIARKELLGRQIDALGRLNQLSMRCFDKAYSYSSGYWLCAGESREFASSAELSAALSDAFDAAYSNAPIVRNELVNRHNLSSAAAAARRTLVERMLAYPSEPRLGITGYPPELSMYRSVLESSGLHHANGARWEFGPVGKYDVGRVSGLWGAIDAFLTTTETGKRSVAELFDVMREPPFGIRDGLLPIYLAAAMLHWQAEVALYENGSFVPKVDIAVFERLMKGPGQFAIQRYRLGEARKYLFDRYSALVRKGRAGTDADAPTLLTAVRPILAFVQGLPPYARSTRSVSPTAIAVRETLLRAREPYRLLFQDLPTALEVSSREVNADSAAAQAFFGRLQEALFELERAYDELLGAIQAQLVEALRLPADFALARAEATRRARRLADRVADLSLKPFVLRLAQESLPDPEWLESLAAGLTNKPPRQWNDQDAVRYGVQLADTAGRFRRVEEIALSTDGAGADEARVLRLGITADTGEEQRDIVRVLPDEEAGVRDLADALVAHLHQSPTSARLALAALAEAARHVMDHTADRKDPQ